MEAFVDVVKIELDLSNTIIYYDLVSLYFTYGTAKLMNLSAQVFLAFLQALLPGMQLSDVSYHFMPNRTRVVESLFDPLLKALEARVNVVNTIFKSFDAALEALNGIEDHIQLVAVALR